MSVIVNSNDGTMKKYKRSEKEESILGKPEAARFDEGKNRFDLLPPWVIDQVVQVYTYGTIKYDDDNWWKGMPWKKVIGPMLRHIWKWLRGEKYDNESGLHHLAHAAWQCLALMEYERNKIGRDNRVPYTLDLMNEEQRNKRIALWRELANKDKLDEYDGMKVDSVLTKEMCDKDCKGCLGCKIDPPETNFPS